MLYKYSDHIYLHNSFQLKQSCAIPSLLFEDCFKFASERTKVNAIAI